MLGGGMRKRSWFCMLITTLSYLILTLAREADKVTGKKRRWRKRERERMRVTICSLIFLWFFFHYLWVGIFTQAQLPLARVLINRPNCPFFFLLSFFFAWKFSFSHDDDVCMAKSLKFPYVLKSFLEAIFFLLSTFFNSSFF